MTSVYRIERDKRRAQVAVRDSAGRVWAYVAYERPLHRSKSFRFSARPSWSAIETNRFRTFQIEDSAGVMGIVSYRRGRSLLRASISWDVIDAEGRLVARIHGKRIWGAIGEVVRAIRRRPVMEYEAVSESGPLAAITERFRRDPVIEVVSDLGDQSRLFLTGAVVAALLHPAQV